MRQLINAVVLAAGKSKRFRGQPSKLITKICGREMILYPIRVLSNLGLETTVVVGNLAATLSQLVSKAGLKNVNFAYQKEPLGTGHAVLCTKPLWNNPNVLVINGDTPLITEKLIQNLIKTHGKNNAAISLITSFVTTPTGYGRIIEDENGIQIVEEKDCNSEQKNIGKVNAGIYLFSRKFIEEHINSLANTNASKEFYLTDLIKVANDKGLTINLVSRSYDEVRGVNNLEELWAVEQIKRSEIMRNLMHNGVRFELAQTIHVDIDVEVGDGSFIGNGVMLLGNTKIGKNSQVLACSIVENSNIGNKTTIHYHSIVRNSIVGNKCEVGPFANVRESSTLEDGVEVGNFVEIKRSKLHTGSTSKHLVYLGDADVGAQAHVGVGTVTCNYDGVKRNKTIIGAKSIIGGHTTLVAPTVVAPKSNITSGSTVSGKKKKSEGKASQIRA